LQENSLENQKRVDSPRDVVYHVGSVAQ